MMASSPKRNLQIWQRPFLKTRFSHSFSVEVSIWEKKFDICFFILKPFLSHISQKSWASKFRLMLSWPSLIKTETENLTTGSSRKWFRKGKNENLNVFDIWVYNQNNHRFFSNIYLSSLFLIKTSKCF